MAIARAQCHPAHTIYKDGINKPKSRGKVNVSAGRWPDSLEALAQLLLAEARPKIRHPRNALCKKKSELQCGGGGGRLSCLSREVRAVEPTKPLLLAGHSFGATVCLEMARQAEAWCVTPQTSTSSTSISKLQASKPLNSFFRATNVEESSNIK